MGTTFVNELLSDLLMSEDNPSATLIQEVLIVLELSQTEMAEKVGVTRGAICRWTSQNESFRSINGSAKMMMVHLLRESGK